LYKSTIDKYSNTIKVDTLLDVAARILLTLRETLKLAIRESLDTINTLLPSLSITDFTDKSTTEPDQINRIPTAKEPQIERFSISYTKVNTIGQNDQNIELFRVFAHLDYKIKLATAKGALLKNIVEGKRIRKPAIFHFKRIY